MQSTRIQEVLEQTGLNWNVRQEVMTTASGIVVPDRKAIVREDTNQVLAVHGDGYYPYQNHQLIELLDKVATKVGIEVHSGGMFGEGKKVFIQLKSNDMKLGNDRIDGYITGVNSFDGSTSLAFGPSNITISCQNTFFGAFRSLETKVKHTKNMEYKIDDFCRGLEQVMKEEIAMFDSIKRMSETRFTKDEQDMVTKILFNIGKEVNLNDGEALSTVIKNKIERYSQDMLSELKDKGDNMWGLFSGVTKYTTHSMSDKDNSENKMFGTYGNRERAVFNMLSEAV